MTGALSTFVENGASGATSTATCPDGDVATGGGFSSGLVMASSPVGGSTSTPPTGWQAIAEEGSVVAYVVCAPGEPV